MKLKYALKILAGGFIQLNKFENSLASKNDKNKVKKLKWILGTQFLIIPIPIICNYVLQIQLLNNKTLVFNNLFVSPIFIIITALLTYLAYLFILLLLINKETIEIIDKYEDFYKNI